MKKLFNINRLRMIIICCLVFVSIAKAQNPIVPQGVYIADPSAHVWKDGKMYIYGSRDESPSYYCSWSYQVLSSSDLRNWTLSNQSFASKGSNDEVPYSNDFLYAPDAQYRNGVYYLYYCLSNAKSTEGVAVSTSPTGPFTTGINIDLNGKNQIDPCVFIDDNGQAYYIWGQFNAKIAKLKPGMTEIDKSTIKDSVLTQKEHHFHEGGYMIKHNGIYYFIYSDISRADMPTCIGYSTSKSPTGPFTYRGVIIDNNHCDPGNWNNHGSLVEFKGKWYVFYHRATNGCNTMRKACLEPIKFNDDGSIPEVEMTSQGAGDALNAFNTIDAERACLLIGNIRIQTFSSHHEVLAGIGNDNKAAYKYINLENGADSIAVRVAPGKNPCKIDVVLDDSWGASIGTIEVPASNTTGWLTVNAALKPNNGIHALWLRFSGDGNDLCKVDQFKFIKNGY
jgi:arabinoxylan arabinofuranohydrolase